MGEIVGPEHFHFVQAADAENFSSTRAAKTALAALGPSLVRIRSHPTLLEWEHDQKGLVQAVERFEGVRTAGDLFDAVLHHHEHVQREKPPNGKRTWFERGPRGNVVVRSGYALCSQAGLEAISAYFDKLHRDELDALRGKLSIGLHRDVEVTDAPGEHRLLVSQAFCSALPVAYSKVPAPYWPRFASLVLEAAYEATMWSAVLNAKRGASSTVLLTLLGGGAFGNDQEWILGAMRHAFEMVSGFPIDVRIVSYGTPSPAVLAVARDL